MEKTVSIAKNASRDVSVVEQRINIYGELENSLRGALAELQSRLSPVMEPDYPVMEPDYPEPCSNSADGCATGRQEECPISERLNDINDRLHGLVYQVEKITRRLQV